MNKIKQDMIEKSAQLFADIYGALETIPVSTCKDTVTKSNIFLAIQNHLEEIRKELDHIEKGRNHIDKQKDGE